MARCASYASPNAPDPSRLSAFPPTSQSPRKRLQQHLGSTACRKNKPENMIHLYKRERRPMPMPPRRRTRACSVSSPVYELAPQSTLMDLTHARALLSGSRSNTDPAYGNWLAQLLRFVGRLVTSLGFGHWRWNSWFHIVSEVRASDPYWHRSETYLLRGVCAERWPISLMLNFSACVTALIQCDLVAGATKFTFLRGKP
ncbi:hypothetical protein B0H11DRAFT_2205846 [Mycena galericulata]|nr:hypothetical protein B0H11DRAFT_2205846 [Mycena galericulata]